MKDLQKFTTIIYKLTIQLSSDILFYEIQLHNEKFIKFNEIYCKLICKS